MELLITFKYLFNNIIFSKKSDNEKYNDNFIFRADAFWRMLKD